MDCRVTTGWIRAVLLSMSVMFSSLSLADESFFLGNLEDDGNTLQRDSDAVQTGSNFTTTNTYTFNNTIGRKGLLYATITGLIGAILPTSFEFAGQSVGTAVRDGNQVHILMPIDYFRPYTATDPTSITGNYSFSVTSNPLVPGSHSYDVEVGWLDPHRESLGLLQADAANVRLFANPPRLAELEVYWLFFIISDEAYLQNLQIRAFPRVTDPDHVVDIHLVGQHTGLIASDTSGSRNLQFDAGELAPGGYSLIVTGRGSNFDDQIPSVQRPLFDVMFEYSSRSSCFQYQSDRSIARNTWHLLSVPCNAPSGTTMADLTSIQEQEGIDPPWDAYVYDPATGYKPLTMDSPIPDAGTGFWLISSIDDLELQMPAGSTPVQNMAGTDPCEPGRRCAMATVSHNNWNLTGNPLNYNLNYAGLRLTNVDSQCLPGTPCLPGNPEHQAEASLFFYNELLGAYVPFSEQNTQVAIPWDGFWARIIAPTAVDPIETPWQLYSHEYPSQFMFVTDGVFDTDLRDELLPTADSGYEAAHRICQAEADAAALPGDFRAWVGNPSAEYTRLDTPYVTAQGKQIASSFDDLTDGAIDIPVNVIAEGTRATGIGVVLTGVASDGTIGADCLSWSTESTESDDFPLSGGIGSMTEIDFGWTTFGFRDCAHTIGRLYCVSQERPLGPR